MVGGDITLSASTVLDIVVGGQGGKSSHGFYGGGYSGGGGDGNDGGGSGHGGGGGGSIIDSSFTNVATAADQTGNGFVEIGPAVAAPEPASLTLLGLCGLGLAGIGWRCRTQATTA